MHDFMSFFGLSFDTLHPYLVSLSAWQSLEFSYPEVFWVLLLLPVIGWWRMRKGIPSDVARHLTAVRMKFRHPLIARMQLPRDSIPKKSYSSVGLNVLKIMVLMLATLAAAQPYKELTLTKALPEKTVRDIVFVVESSVSFVIKDYRLDGQPASRLDAVKTVLDRFVSGLEGNRFGLVLYAESAYTLMPLTADDQAARLMLKRLKPYLAGRTDEAMGEALGLALQQAEQDTPTTQKRIAVLISDGQTMPSRVPLAEVIGYAQGMNLPIYTIGVGAGSKAADERQFRGLIYEPLEKGSLQRLAKETGGRYYQIGSGDQLQQVLSAIDKAEGVPMKREQKETLRTDLYPYFAGAAILAFLVYLLTLSVLAFRESRREQEVR